MMLPEHLLNLAALVALCVSPIAAAPDARERCMASQKDFERCHGQKDVKKIVGSPTFLGDLIFV